MCLYAHSVMCLYAIQSCVCMHNQSCVCTHIQSFHNEVPRSQVYKLAVQFLRSSKTADKEMRGHTYRHRAYSRRGASAIFQLVSQHIRYLSVVAELVPTNFEQQKIILKRPVKSSNIKHFSTTEFYSNQQNGAELWGRQSNIRDVAPPFMCNRVLFVHNIVICVSPSFIVNQLSGIYRYTLFTDMFLCWGQLNLIDFVKLHNLLSVSTS